MIETNHDNDSDAEQAKTDNEHVNDANFFSAEPVPQSQPQQLKAGLPLQSEPQLPMVQALGIDTSFEESCEQRVESSSVQYEESHSSMPSELLA